MDIGTIFAILNAVLSLFETTPKKVPPPNPPAIVQRADVLRSEVPQDGQPGPRQGEHLPRDHHGDAR